MRFHTYYIAILAESDIEKAFLQIGIQKTEMDMTQFLWFKDHNQPERVKGNLCTYHFCRVQFGIICSPFLLEAILKYHLKRDGPDAATMICDNTICQLEPFQLRKLVIFTKKLNQFLKEPQ